MRRYLMCRPSYFDVTYDINPWMTDQKGQVDKIRAITEWYALYDEICHSNAEVSVMDGIKGLPDLVFTANAGFIQDRIAVLSKFTSKERRPEEAHYQKWFEDNGYTVIQPKHKYEGEGDHLVDDNSRHWIGSGFRTNKRVAKELGTILNTKINVLELVDPRWYHLDTCFCPLNNSLMWYPGAFSEKSQQLIRDSFKYNIPVTESDALLFCCNCLRIGDKLFMPRGSVVVTQLRALNYNVMEFDLGEFLKAGGSAKCLVLDCNHIGS